MKDIFSSEGMEYPELRPLGRGLIVPSWLGVVALSVIFGLGCFVSGFVAARNWYPASQPPVFAAGVLPHEQVLAATTVEVEGVKVAAQPGSAIRITGSGPVENIDRSKKVEATGASLTTTSAEAVGAFKTETPQGNLERSSGGGLTTFDWKSKIPIAGLGFGIVGILAIIGGAIFSKWDVGLGLKVMGAGLLICVLGFLAPVFVEMAPVLILGSFLVSVAVLVYFGFRTRNGYQLSRSLELIIKGVNNAKRHITEAMSPVVRSWAMSVGIEQSKVEGLLQQLGPVTGKAITKYIEEVAGSEDPMVRSVVSKLKSKG